MIYIMLTTTIELWVQSHQSQESHIGLDKKNTNCSCNEYLLEASDPHLWGSNQFFLQIKKKLDPGKNSRH